jgi:IgA peptidase M64/peptidase M64-like protein
MLLWLMVLVLSALVAQPAPFDFDRTMRVDYFHTGAPKGGESIALDRVVNDGPWPGSRTQLLDSTNLGKYLFEVRDAESGATLYSRGFASVYGEWETTPEAKTLQRTFHESMRFPWPSRSVRVVLKKRQEDNSFGDIWSTSIDPSSRFVSSAQARRTDATVRPLSENGPPAEKVDLVVIGDGYTREQLPKFRADAKRMIDKLFAEEPFQSRRKDFNVRTIELPSAESGVNRPNAGVFRRTPLSAEYNIFDSERYVLTLDNRTLRDVAAMAPYEFVEILVNEQTYGGGGIFNDHATSSVDSEFSDYVFVHEFGHHFAALADEYYTSDVAYETGAAPKVEPWEPNVTALLDPSTLKWRDLVTTGTPLPTPWEKDTFERNSQSTQARRREIRKRNAPESEMNALFRDQQAFETKLLSGMTYSNAVGAFEGANYEPRGLYRPQADCIMFTRDRVGFCRVCQRALSRIIDLYSR